MPEPATRLAWSIAADDGPWRQLSERQAVAQARLWALSQYVFGPRTRALGHAGLADPMSHRKALVACMPGETHPFGVSFVALALMRSARRASLRPRMQILRSRRASAQQPGPARLLGADGDGLAQNVDRVDLDALVGYADRRRHSPAVMVTRAALDDVVLLIQRRRFGIFEEDAAGRASGVVPA